MEPPVARQSADIVALLFPAGGKERLAKNKRRKIRLATTVRARAKTWCVSWQMP